MTTLEQAAEEFDRRAMMPQYTPTERARIMACAQWLRDMQEDYKNDSDDA
jgi:hypothetical protein